MSRVERIDDSGSKPRRQEEQRETQPNPRKISRTPGLAEGDELTVDEALENDAKPRSRA